MVLIIQIKVNDNNEALSNDYGKLHWLLNKSKGHLRGETFGHLVQVGDQFQKVNNLTLDTTGLGKIQGNTMCVFGPLLSRTEDRACYAARYLFRYPCDITHHVLPH